MTDFPCPKCSLQRAGVETPCERCGWTPAPPTLITKAPNKLPAATKATVPAASARFAGAHRIVLFPCVVASAAGLGLSLIVHVAAFLGLAILERTLVLHFGIFIVWVPVTLVAGVLTRGCQRRDYWKVALRGCPMWMKQVTYGFFGYAVVNFVLFMAVPLGNLARLFSGHWMAFYAAAFAILYSATQAHKFDHGHRCPAGHVVSPPAKYCEKCGLTGGKHAAH